MADRGIRIAFLTILLISPAALPGLAQVTNRENYDIKAPKDLANACKRQNDVLAAMPKEHRFSAILQNDSVYMLFPDETWFARLFPARGDGIAIDLVQKEQFQCDNISRFPNTWSHKGFLLPPVYRDELMRSIIHKAQGYVLVPVGKLPPGLRKENIEANYTLLEDKNFCNYRAIVNIDFHGWKMLDTGLYYDTLLAEKLSDKYKELSKTLHFTIPFPRNKSTYNPDDLRPLYDSLRMTDYVVRTITIRAYTSVEGSYERNVELQEERAQSIVSALQSFQSEKIKSSVSASENWVEFLDNLSKTSPELTSLSKEEIKEKLKSPALLARLEPTLARHRKALVEITLEKRLSYRESNPAELRFYFEQTIQQKNLDEALYLQHIIFTRIGSQEIPDQFIEDVKVPAAVEFGSLLINEASFQFDHHYLSVAEAIQVFENLYNLLPGNSHVQYNLCALRLRSWAETNVMAEPASLKAEIDGLLKRRIHPSLVRRLQINYHIILSEKFSRKQQFADKDRALKFVFDTYKGLALSDDDLVNLAKYFSHYSKFDWAEKVIAPRIKSLDVSEDLLFYYLSLTLFEERNTRSTSYRATMLNAINGNRTRFCNQFNASGKGGISFQLLTDPYLKKTYCENCK